MYNGHIYYDDGNGPLTPCDEIFPPEPEDEDIIGDDCVALGICRIEKDTSITNNPIANCLYEALMNPALVKGLLSILNNFQGETGYNVTIKLGNISNEGETVQTDPDLTTSKNVTITIKSSNATDPDYSRVYVAKTFIHEAFHAKLIQYAVQHLGTTEMARCPKSVNDATLSELMDYVETSSKEKGTWSSSTHNWMVVHIEEMTASLKEFVEKAYPAKAAEDFITNSTDPMEPYRALMFMGLQSSSFYTENIDSQRDSTFNSIRGYFVSGTTACPTN